MRHLGRRLAGWVLVQALGTVGAVPGADLRFVLDCTRPSCARVLRGEHVVEGLADPRRDPSHAARLRVGGRDAGRGRGRQDAFEWHEAARDRPGAPRAA